MNFTPLSDLSSSSFGEILSIIFSDSYSIISFILAFIVFLALSYLAVIAIQDEALLAGVFAGIAAVGLGAAIIISSVSMGFTTLNEETALENIQEKYNIEELEKFAVESDSDTKIYSGNYYNLENKTVADLSIMFDPETGEPTILTNAQVSEEFVKSLEK